MSENNWTVGKYLAARLAELEVRHYFTVPSDYNLILLDEFLNIDQLQMVSCCNELNAGYAADGYARATGGLAVAVVTYSVGGLSLLNAVAGAYAEDLPLIAVSGAPNTNSTAEYELLNHTLGEVQYDYVREIFSRVTADAITIQHPSEAPSQIDQALETVLRTRKPVYLEIACNISAAPVSAPNSRVFSARLSSNQRSLDRADDKGWGCRVTTEAKLANALSKALTHEGLALIEVQVDRDDCSKNLLEWGSHVAKNNGRPPRHLSWRY